MITHVVAKTLIFNDEGKLLILRRSMDDAHRPGGLDLPGGKVDKGEDILEGAVREIKEESGIDVTADGLHWVFADTAANFNTGVQDMVNMVRVTFAARIKDADVTLSHEHDEYSWHALDEALELLTGLRFETVIKHMVENDVAHDLWQTKSAK